jgi:hypothetical protein
MSKKDILWRLTCLLIWFALIFCLTSCRKTGCTDPYAENFSTVANKEDGSCIYILSSHYALSNWEFENPSWVNTIYWEELTPEAVGKGSIQVFVQIYNNGSWTALPLTIYQSPFYSTTIEWSVNINTIHLNWTDSDLIEPIEPPKLNFKVVIG